MTFRLSQWTENAVRKTFPSYTNNPYLLIVRAMVVAFVLGVSFSVGVFSSLRVVILVTGGLLLVAFYLIHQRFPWFGFISLIIASFFIRTPLLLGPLAYMPIASFLLLALALFWLFRQLFIERRIELNPSRSVYAAIALMVVGILAFISGYLPWFPVEGAGILPQLVGLGMYIISMLAFLVGVHEIRQLKHLKTILYVYLGLSGIIFFGSLIPAIQARVYNLFLLGARGSMFWNWAAALSFSQALVNTRLKWGWRLFFGGLTFALFYASLTVSRQWLSGWLPALVAVGIIIWFYFKKLRIFILLSAFVLLFYFTQSSIWRNLLASNNYSLLTRYAAFDIIFEIIKVNPVLGLGPSNYYFYTPLYSILGWYVQFNSHNQYIDLIAQTGILGLLAFLWLAFEIIRYAWKKTTRFPDGFPRAYAYGVLGGMAGMLVAGMLGDWAIPFVYNIGVKGLSATLPAWVFAGGLFALGGLLKAGENEVPAQAAAEA